MAIREKNLPQSFGSKGVNYFARKLSYVMEKKRQPSIKGVNPLASIKRERGSNFMGYPGQNHRQRGKEVFLKKIGAKSLFFEKEKMGTKRFFEKRGEEFLWDTRARTIDKGAKKIFEKIGEKSYF